MIEVRLTPLHGLKRSKDFPFALVFKNAELAVSDTARMELRYDLTDPDPVDTLTTEEDGRIVLSAADGTNVRVKIRLNGEHSRLYPITRADGTSRYRGMTKEEAPSLTTAELKIYKVLPLYGTLIVTGPGNEDRAVGTLDFALLFEGSYTRGATP